jgi:hypothetical protein
MKITAKKAGKTVTFTQQTADVICEHIASGMSLRGICKMNGMPAASTVFKWLNENTKFSEQYARARDEQAETLADEMIDIADGASSPVMVEGLPLMVDGKPVMITTSEAINHARLKIDTRKWIASKLKPKKYGDNSKIEVELSTGLADRVKAARERASNKSLG